MVSLEKAIIAHITLGGEKFEILVDPDAALSFRLGKKADFSNILVADEIFKDAKKGERYGPEKLKKAFGTEDVFEIAKKIIKEGEVPLTTEQRRAMAEEKRRKMISLIARDFIDPRTGAPHTPQRVERALEEARVPIDPLKPVESQLEEVIKKLRTILPMKFEKVKLSVKIPADIAAKSYGSLKGYASNEEWLSDGSLSIMIEVPAGLRAETVDKIGKVTQGRALIKELSK